MVLENYIANDYVRAFAVFLLLLIVLRLLLAIVMRVILKLTTKTKTNLDDIIIKKSSFPITAILFFISLRIAVNELNLADPLGGIVNKILYSFITVFVGYIVYVIINISVENVWMKVGKKTEKKVIQSLSSFILGAVKIALVVLVLLYVLDYWGVQIGPLLAGLGIAGLAVALALQPTLSNVFSGVAIILDKSVHVGDVVSLDASTSGRIKKIGLRSTKILTFDNELIIVPNSKLADSNIQNVALPEPKTRVVIPFGVAYGTNVDRVKKLILGELKKVKDFSPQPNPHVKFLEMGDSSLNFKAYFYINSHENRLSAKDQANTLIYNVLNKNKIEIPFPQRDVHMKK